MSHKLGSESQILEFKEKINDGVYKTLSAFANTEGGTLYIGIDDNGTPKGINLSSKEVEGIVSKIIDSLGIHPEIVFIEIEEKTVLKLSVSKSLVPISFSGKYYKRLGNTTREMSTEELKSFFNKNSNWDCLVGDYDLSEIDETTVKRFLNKAFESGRISFKEENIFEALTRLKLIVNEKITNAAIILFGKNPQKYFTNAILRLGRFKDEFTIISDKQLDGNLFSQIEKAEEQIKQLINLRYEIKDFERTEIWDYPLTAIREAFLNSIIHRDYFKNNIQTQVKIFDDYIWFYNAGGLVEGLSLLQLKGVHPSLTRNPLIMHIFYLAGYVEEYGSGIARIINALKKQNLPEPEFKEEFAGFSVYFHKEKSDTDYSFLKDLKERQIKALLYIKENGSIGNKEYQELYQVSKRTATNDLTELLDKNILEKSTFNGKVKDYILNDKWGNHGAIVGAIMGQLGQK